MQIKDVNYSSLVSEWVQFAHQLKASFKTFSLSKLLLFSVVALLIVATILTGNIRLLILVAVIVCLVLAYFLTRGTNSTEVSWQLFAEDNRWAIEAAEYEDIPPSLQGMSGANPTSKTIIADLNGCMQRLLTCYSNLPYLVICIQLPKAFPHIILNGIRNNAGSEFLFENAKRVSLEGDFDHYFRLYIDKNENIDALSIITPDVMSTMIAKNLKQDLEIYHDRLYFISELPEVTAKSLQPTLEAVQEPVSEILRRVATLSYVTQASPLFQKAPLIPIPRVVLTLTRRSKILILVLAVPIILMAIYMFNFARNFRP